MIYFRLLERLQFEDKLWKSFIVSHTKIVFNEKELLQLIHQHLIKQGLKKSAAQLQQEADLPDVPASRITITPTGSPLVCINYYKYNGMVASKCSECDLLMPYLKLQANEIVASRAYSFLQSHLFSVILYAEGTLNRRWRCA